MNIHKEGRLLLITTLALIIATLTLINNYVGQGMWFYTVLGLGIIIFLLFLQFFRNPTPNVILDGNQVIAPADGKVVVIEQVQESEYLKDSRIQVSIFMSPFNVHVNRNPISGVVEYFKYHPGKFLVAWHPKASTDNERTTFVITHSNQTKILFRQIAGALARRIKWYAKEGDQVTQGEEFGFIKFGSRVDVFLPLNATIDVKIDQITKGGETILATLN